jgi:hypothetical protein
MGSACPLTPSVSEPGSAPPMASFITKTRLCHALNVLGFVGFSLQLSGMCIFQVRNRQAGRPAGSNCQPVSLCCLRRAAQSPRVRRAGVEPLVGDCAQQQTPATSATSAGRRTCFRAHFFSQVTRPFPLSNPFSRSHTLDAPAERDARPSLPERGASTLCCGRRVAASRPLPPHSV